MFSPALGAITFRLLGLKEGLEARVNASASGGRTSVAGCWLSVLANKGGRNLEETTFVADATCNVPHWAVCSINDLLDVTKIDKKTSESPAGGLLFSVSPIAVKTEDSSLPAAAILEIFEGSPSADDKTFGAVKTVYTASEPGRCDVFLNWGRYWAVFQGAGMAKASFPFDVMQGKDNAISVPLCAAGFLGPKQARFVLTWSGCLQSGVDMQLEGPAGVCCSADKAKGNIRVETAMDAPAAPGPISFILRNGTDSGGDGRKRNYELRIVSKDPKKFSCCSLWQAQSTVQMYTIAGLVKSWTVPPPAADAAQSFEIETWKVVEIHLVDGGSFEVGPHQDCELHDIAAVERT